MSDLKKDLMGALNSIDQMAVAMWRQEAIRANAKSTADRRTLEAFLDESEKLQVKWRGYATAAVMALLDCAPTSLTINTDDGYVDVEKIKSLMKNSRPDAISPNEKTMEAQLMAAAKLILDSEAGEYRTLVYDACAGISKVYKFNEVLKRIYTSLEKSDA